ncbi:hypothetical protein [Domibacillus enclensis]|nr:hypothetical protein [Domibacillus enclensis]
MILTEEAFFIFKIGGFILVALALGYYWGKASAEVNSEKKAKK